jgi:hypothetical protein
MRTAWAIAGLLLLVAAPAAPQGLVERAKALELDTPYVPPPGDPLEHHASGFAKIGVRLGHYRGGATGTRSFARALALLLGAVPKRS